MQEAFLSGTFSSLSLQELEETACQFIDLISSNIYEWPLLGRTTFTGTMACWALQSLGVEHWQRYIEEGASPSEALETVLESAIGNVKERVNAIKERYNFPTLAENIEGLAAHYSIENIKKGYMDFSGTILKLRGVSYSRKDMHEALPYTDLAAEQVYYRNDYTATASYVQCRFMGEIPWVVLDEKNDGVEMKFKSHPSIRINDTLVLGAMEGNFPYDTLNIEAPGFFLRTYAPGRQLTISKNSSVIEIDMHKEIWSATLNL